MQENNLLNSDLSVKEAVTRYIVSMDYNYLRINDNINNYTEILGKLSIDFLKAGLSGRGNLNQNIKNQGESLYLDLCSAYKEIVSAKPPFEELHYLHNDIINTLQNTVELYPPNDITQFQAKIIIINSNNEKIRIKVEEIRSYLKRKFDDEDYFNNLKQTVYKVREELRPAVKQLASELEKNTTSKSDSSGCFIATAALGTPCHPLVKELQEFRDKTLIRKYYGAIFINYYNRFSPKLAKHVKNSKLLKFFVIILVLLPSLLLVRLSRKIKLT